MNLLDYFNNKKILITGGNGYIGSNLIDVLKDYDCEILMLNRTPYIAKTKKTKATFSEIISDVRNPDIWKDILRDVDIVFYFAAQTSIYHANANPQEDFSLNVQPVFNLLEACRQNQWRPSIIFAGTVTVAGITISLPVSEKNPDAPLSIYDLHKVIVEKYLKYYAKDQIVQSVIMRLANVYGPGPNSKSADRGILNMMIRKALAGEELTLYGEGNYIRDYVYIDDVVNAFLLAAINIDKLNGTHVIVGSGEGSTVRKAFEMVKDNVKKKSNISVGIVNVPMPENISPVELRNFVADHSYLSNSTGWSAETNLNNGINKTIDYYKSKYQ